MLGIDWLSGSPGFSVWLCCRPAHDDRGALGCFPIPTLGHPLRTGCLSQVADVRPRMRTAALAGGGGGGKFTAHNSWPSSIVNQ